jgi:methylmalonyl-CoA mutase N-terminal domain/subunit
MYPKDRINELGNGLKLWEETCLKKELETKGEWKKEFKTASGILVNRIYTPLDLNKKGWDYLEKLGFPGNYPFTRGISPTMYRSNIFIMSQYGGFGTAEETNRHIKYVISQGGTGYGIAQDLPTQVGLDSDNPLARGEIGKVGVAIDSLADVETIFDGIPVENVEIYTTSNATGPIFLAFLLALCEKRNVSPGKLKVSIQNEILKEFVARGTYIFPPKPSVKFSCDLIEYCLKKGLKNIQPIWFCGYHMREAGGNIIQELAFTLANAVAYLDNVVSRGVDLNHFNQPAVAFTAGMDLFEEVCKHRAFRRMWAKLMKERYHVTAEQAMSVFFRDHTAAHQLTEQQPLNNIIRSTVAGLVQALSGNQVVSLASYDEAYALPSSETLKISLRTQQIIAYETGVVNTVDPLAGSYYVECLTDEIEERVTKLFDRVQSMGGAVSAIEQGFMITEIGKSAYQQLKEVESGERVMVGLNKYREDEEVHLQLFRGDPEVEEKEIKKVQKLRRERDNHKVKSTLKQLGEAAREGINLVESLVPAVKAYATLGEICDTLKEVFGEHIEAEY